MSKASHYRKELSRLTNREKEVLSLYAQGLVYKEIGAKLGMARGTVRNHLETIRDVLQALNSTHAVVIAIQRGEIDVWVGMTLEEAPNEKEDRQLSPP